MKTALQELIETLEEMVAHGGDMDLLPAIQHAKELIEKEKSQIVSAFKSGASENEAYWCTEPLLYAEDGEFYYKAEYKDEIKTVSP